ncbi:PF07600 family protein [Leptospira interrogans serovar Copenhageni/Icterohaemorrhagiae]|nr:PF07600 family protein [Leptospira interrogans serovar Copenhageni/Icterohaemorrhagiae]
MLGFYSDFLQKFLLQIVPFGKFEKPFSNMDILLLDDGQRIESALVEDSVGTDSLLVPDVYWNRLNAQEKKALRSKLPFFYLKKIFQADRFYETSALSGGKNQIQSRPLVKKKFSVRVHTGVWATLGVLAAAHGVSRCYLFNYMLWLEDFVEKTIFL